MTRANTILKTSFGFKPRTRFSTIRNQFNLPNNFSNKRTLKYLRDLNRFRTFAREGNPGSFQNPGLSLENLLRFINPIEGHDIVLRIGNKFNIISGRTNNILEQIREGFEEGQLNEYSKNVVQNFNNSIEDIEVIIRRRGGRVRPQGGFFPYLFKYKSPKFFEKYGINSKIDCKTYSDNCLITALSQAKLPNHILNTAKLLVKNGIFPKISLDKLSKEVGITIILKQRNKKKQISKKVYNKGCDIVVNIGLIESHYFLIEKVPCTSFAIKNYIKLCSEPDFLKINEQNGKYFKRQNNTFISSFKLISILVDSLDTKNPLLEKITAYNGLHKTPYNTDFDVEELYINNHPDDTGKGDTQSYYYKPLKSVFNLKQHGSIDYTTLFFDFETDTSGIEHIPYLVNFIDENNENHTFFGEDCGLQMLNYINTIYSDKNIMMVAHNLRYDFSFVIKWLKIRNIIKTGSQLKSLSCKYRSLNLVFKDSYSIIPKPLRDFGDCFKLNVSKEVMPYKLYNSENVLKSSVSIESGLNLLDYSERDQFLKNIKLWKLNRKDGTYFDHIEYSAIYCRLDCEVLKKGYNIFKGWIKELTTLDIEQAVSLPQIANNYLGLQGCFDGVCLISGFVNKFIRKCVVGGRTMTRQNKKWHTKIPLSDFDGVSLYPSAMNRMKGFLLGTPKVIEDLKEFEDNMFNEYVYNKDGDAIDRFGNILLGTDEPYYDGYFIEIDIKSVGIKRDFPILNRKVDEVRNYSNDILGNYYVDKTTLEDLIKFHKIEFKVIRGYYFDEGFNPQIKETIKFLFEERLRLKTEKNPIQEVYKLLMNASYGKLIQRPIDTKIKFVYSKNKLEKTLDYNHNFVKNYVKVSEDVYCITMIKPLETNEEQKKMVHLGSEILSMSKRIMNEVMCLSEDLGINIYYQDTDSMHIELDKIDLLSNEYRKLYNRELIGKQLGQFHSDFSGKSEKEIYACESFFLGKKSYIDKLVLVQDNKEIYDYHTRMKGLSSKSIEGYCGNLYSDKMDLYYRMYNDESFTFDRTLHNLCYDASNYGMKNRSHFPLTLNFRKEKGIIGEN